MRAAKGYGDCTFSLPSALACFGVAFTITKTAQEPHVSCPSPPPYKKYIPPLTRRPRTLYWSGYPDIQGKGCHSETPPETPISRMMILITIHRAEQGHPPPPPPGIFQTGGKPRG